MASFRPNYGKSRSREAEYDRRRKEEEAKRAEELQRKSLIKSETNFPILVKKSEKMVVPDFDASFASKATEWKETEERDRRLAEFRAKEAAQRHAEFMAMAMIPRVGIRRTVYEEDEEEDEEPDILNHPPKVDSDGWQEVKAKARKQKYTLSCAELAEKYAEAGDEEEDGEYNVELFESKRRDHP
jgi:hypothetical protein